MKAWQVALFLAAVFAAFALIRCGADPTPPASLELASPEAAGASTGSGPLADQAGVVREKFIAEVPHDPEDELRGIVVDTADVPIPGATLTAWLQVDRQIAGLSEVYKSIESLAAQTVSDAAGRFSLRLEPRIVYDLVAIQSGFARIRLHSLYAGEDLRIVLGRAASISGLVTDAGDGMPLAGVEVMATQGTTQSRGDERLYALSGADGEFRFENLPPNYFDLRFDLAGYARRYGTELTIVEGEQARADVTLDRGATLRGRVTDGDTHLPIPGAEVGLRLASHPARTDADGRYLLTGVPVGYSDSVFIRAVGYGKYDFPLRDVPAEGLEQDFGLLRGRTALGRVVDQNGVPVSGARIVAASQKNAFDSWQTDRRLTQTDEAGLFTLTSLRVDLRHTLLIAAEGHAVGIFDFPASEWGAREIRLGDLVVEPACALAGVVVDTNGNPQPNLFVSLSGEPWSRDALGPSLAGGEGYMDRGGLGFDNLSARTDARGRFAFASLPTGQYYLSAGRKGYARRAESEIELLYKGESVTDLKLVLDVGLTIAGMVVNRDGQPVPEASVSVHHSGEASRITYNLTQPDGSFLLVGLDAGSYLLLADGGFSIRHYGELLVNDVMAGDSGLRLVLPDALEISGVVFGPDDQPLQGATVQVWTSEPTHNACNSGRDGRFTLWVSDDRNVTIAAFPPFVVYAGTPVDGSLTVTVENVTPGTMNLVIRLPRLP